MQDEHAGGVHPDIQEKLRRRADQGLSIRQIAQSYGLSEVEVRLAVAASRTRRGMLGCSAAPEGV
ncbi:hypothetical protein [Polycladidibacter hongkongensis]|uniref:hypothetical protein n=1 Tax=Polycladidibacter hongkongensis TaxID=1647556 RepID=UPI00082A4BB1|nr:hypothetical protein [Pseudovibrio hongkongensis]